MQAKPESADPNSPKSDETAVEDPPNMKEHKALLKKNYQISTDVTDSINYRGSSDKIQTLYAIALMLFKK